MTREVGRIRDCCPDNRVLLVLEALPCNGKRLLQAGCFWSVALLAISGCQFTATEKPSLNNVLAVTTLPFNMTKWESTHYQEECTINTEPPGCRIYCQNKYIGTSPLTTKLDGGIFELWIVAGNRKWLTEGGKSDRITWTIGAAQGWICSHHPHDRGRLIGAGDTLFDNAVTHLKDGLLTSLPKPPATITTQRTILLNYGHSRLSRWPVRLSDGSACRFQSNQFCKRRTAAVFDRESASRSAN